MPEAAGAAEATGVDVRVLLLLSAGAGESAVLGAVWLRGLVSGRCGLVAVWRRLAAGFCGVAGAGAGVGTAGAGGVFRDNSSTWVACGMAGAAVMRLVAVCHRANSSAPCKNSVPAVATGDDLISILKCYQE